MTLERVEVELTRRDVVALWMAVINDIRQAQAARDPEWIAEWARSVSAMRDNPCVRWPTPIPGWGWA